MSPRHFAAGLLLACAAALGSACLWSTPSAIGAVQGATGRALEADTVHFELTSSVEGLEDSTAAEAFAMSARGAFDADGDPAVFAFETGELTFEIRVLDGFAYTRFEAGGQWMKMDSEAFEDFGDILAPMFDPYALLEELGIDPSAVDHEGSDEIRGEKAERYRIDIPARDFDQDVESFFSLTRNTKVLFWIGKDGLPARIVIEATGDADDFDLDDAAKDVTARLQVDLFDYGEPVDVQAPPEDELTDFPNLGAFGGGSFANPFEGKACYGDRIDECLAVNPELEAMAQDPRACTGLDVRVCIVPVGNVRADIVKAIVDFHKETKNIDVVVLPGVPLTPADIDYDSSQVTAETLRRKQESVYGVTAATRSTFIAITPIDVRPESGEFAWMFGNRWGGYGWGHTHGVFSYFRMLHVEPYNGDPITDKLVYERASKYAARYTALLHLKYPYSEDIDYLDYYEMYGFGDLDSMGMKWPDGDPPCLGFRHVICVYPDGKYADALFEADVRAAAERVARETGLPVEFRVPRPNFSFQASKPDWGNEYAGDLTIYLKDLQYNQRLVVVGVTDDNLAQDTTVAPGIDRPFGDLQMSIVSGYGAGKPGSAQHRERIYRLVLRGVLVANFGMALNDDPGSLLYRGITSPDQLDGKAIPPIPR